MTIYFISVGVAGILILLYLRFILRRIQRQRVERIRDVKQFNAVDTSSPVSDPKKQARSLAQTSIASRFSVIQRGILIFAAVIWIIALTFPLLSRIPSALVSILVGAGAVIIGIAVRPFLENMISGIVISFSKQLRTGDTVIIDETYGTVEDISLTHTVIKSWDWRRYIIPNSTMITKEFLNFSINDSFIWEHVEFWVDHSADIEEVEKIALQTARENKYFSDYESPRFWVMGMDKEAVKCWVAGWTDSPSDAWLFKVEVRKRLITEFGKKGIKSHAYRHDWPKNSDGSIMTSDTMQKEN
ncbi:MAG: mechanosensitive ion channel [Candidatus Marinimicrobia bacterium]|nr:mechanosensitive ion channel [Candidatus Neomarinimicrobiota bacterium]